ncbi:MAG: ABC transporter ATP-binding protein, partial [Thermoguttaceae bacterium]
QVEAHNLTKEYRQGDQTVIALHGVDLSIEKDEFVALLGCSGSGKSTLLNLLAGIDRPTAGRILVGNMEITRLSRGQLADWRAANIGYILQTPNLVPVLTVYENVELPLLLVALSYRERHNRVQRALEAVGLLECADYYPRLLSGGEEQRAGIARAIVSNPAILLGDEPTGDLDPGSSQRTVELLEELNVQLGVTLLIATCDPTLAVIARRRFKLVGGRLAESCGDSVFHEPWPS